MLSVLAFLFFFFFNDTATTEIYTLSLHDALPIYLGPQRHAGRLAHLDQLRPARLGQAEPLERAEQHGQLVDAELRVPAQFVLARRAAAGLEVHHDGAARLVRLQPVHPAGDLHLADSHLERLLHRDELARVLRVPVEEPPHHALGQRALLRAIPGAPEVEMVPDFIDAISHGPFGSTLDRKSVV